MKCEVHPEVELKPLFLHEFFCSVCEEEKSKPKNTNPNTYPVYLDRSPTLIEMDFDTDSGMVNFVTEALLSLPVKSTPAAIMNAFAQLSEAYMTYILCFPIKNEDKCRDRSCFICHPFKHES